MEAGAVGRAGAGGCRFSPSGRPVCGRSSGVGSFASAAAPRSRGRDHHRKGVIDDSDYPITVLEECLAQVESWLLTKWSLLLVVSACGVGRLGTAATSLLERSR
jgi:hypothetical protein